VREDANSDTEKKTFQDLRRIIRSCGSCSVLLGLGWYLRGYHSGRKDAGLVDALRSNILTSRVLGN